MSLLVGWIAEMKDRFFESSLHVVMIAITARLVLDQQVFYFTQPDTTPTKLVQDIIGRLNNAPIKNEVPTEKATLNTEPGSDNSTQRKVDTEESVHPMDKLSDCATYHLIPLFKPEEAELRLFCVHPAGRYAMNLAPLANGFTQQVRMNYLSTQQLSMFCQMVKKWLNYYYTRGFLIVHTKNFKLVVITASFYTNRG